MPTSNEIGFKAESAALHFLKRQGLTLRERNYSCKQGELDLIMQDDETLVFVEVRTRKHSEFGSGLTTVRQQKQHRLMRAATAYLLEKELYEKIDCRFDIVSIDRFDKITWVKNAIEKKYD